MWLTHWLKEYAKYNGHNVEPVHKSNMYTLEQPVSLDVTLGTKIRKSNKET